MKLEKGFFQGKRILALDYGEKVIGTALFHWNSDPYPTPYEKIINLGQSDYLQKLKTIIDDEFVEIAVIGIPYLTDGQATKTTEKMKKFFNWFSQEFPDLNCYEQDETLSTFEAEQRMLNSPQYNFKIDPKKIDSLSAAIILEDFIKRVENESSL